MQNDSDGVPVHLDISSPSIDEAHAVLSEGYNGSDFDSSLTDRPFAWRHTAVGDGDMTLRRTVFDASMRGVAAPVDDFIVAWARDGRGAIDVDGDAVSIQGRHPVVFPTDRPYLFDLADMDMSLVHVNRSIVERLAAERDGGDPCPVSFDHTTAPTVAGRRFFEETIRQVATVVFSGETTLTSLVRAELARRTGTAMLTAFRYSRGAPSGDASHGPGGIESASVRQAIEFVRAHAESPLTTTDIAREVGLSPRALQQAFRNHLSTTPTGFVRQVRLERVRGELVAADEPGMTVADVARRWGFLHLGRFSAAYREQFGEPPSSTLRSARP